MNQDKRCLLVRVTGRVQGVCFRHYARQEADRLGVTGWIKNASNGDVEALICGDGVQLAAMQAWLAHGPSMAQVEDMHAAAAELSELPDSFRIMF